MTTDSPIPDTQNGEAGPETDEGSTPMPGWVPVAIGIVLVSMAGLAVYTGLRYRPATLARVVGPNKAAMTSSMDGAGPPGEPQAGASRMYPGESGDNVPLANPNAGGKSRVMIEGGREGTSATARLVARRGMILDVTPSDAVVYVNDVPIGEAHQFATHDEVYDFPAPGSYTIRLITPGYKEQRFTVTAEENATQELAKIGAVLQKQ